MTTTPLYTETTESLGWSPEDLSPPFDLDAFVKQSYIRSVPATPKPKGKR